MSEAIAHCKIVIGGSLGTIALNAGATYLVRQGFGQPLTYAPSLLAGGVASAAFLANCYFDDQIKSLFSENNKEKAKLLMLGSTLLSGGIAAKLLCKEVSKTAACALSVLSFVTSHVAGLKAIAIALQKSPIENFKTITKDYYESLTWAFGRDN